MPTEVDVDGVGTIEFPDSMSPDEIQGALAKHAPAIQASKESSTDPKPLSPGAFYRAWGGAASTFPIGSPEHLAELAEVVGYRGPSTEVAESAAREVPKESRDQFLDMVHREASQRKATSSQGFVGRAASAAMAGLDRIESTVERWTGQGLDDDAAQFAKRIHTTRSKADPISSPDASMLDPREWVVGAAGMAPEMALAGGVGRVAGLVAKGIGTAAELGSKALGRATSLASGAGAAGTFAPGMYDEDYDSLLEDGVAPSTARWAAGISATLRGLLFARLPEALRGKVAESVAGKLGGSIAKQYALTVGIYGPGAMAGAAAIDQAVQDVAKGDPAYKDVLGRAFDAYKQAIGPMALLAAPGHLAESGRRQARNQQRAEAWRAWRAQQAQVAPETSRFTPTADWQDIPQGAILPPGLEIRMNVTTGRNEARWPPGSQGEQNAEQVESPAPPDGNGGAPERPAVGPGGGSPDTTDQGGKGVLGGGSGPGPGAGPTGTASEAEKVGRTTGTRHAKTDEQFAEVGGPPRTPTEPQSPEQWDAEASRRIAADPSLPEKTVAKFLVPDPPPADKIDNAVLRQHLVALRNSNLSDPATLQRYLDANRAAVLGGSEVGRALVSRKTDAKDDLTLEGMTQTWQREVGSDPDPEQFTKIQDLSKQVEQLQAERDQRNREKMEDDIDWYFNDLKQQAQEKRQATTDSKQPSPRKQAQERKVAIDKKIADAWKDVWDVLKKPPGPETAGAFAAVQWGGEVAVRFGKLVAAYIEKGATNFYELMRRAKEDVGAEAGEEAKSYFTRAWQEAESRGEVPKPAQVDPEDRLEVSKRAKEILKAVVDDDPQVDRETAIEKVWGALKGEVPGLTRNQTYEAVSGYGIRRELSKDPNSVKVRDLAGQSLQISKINDILQGEAPKKTGMEQRAPTDAERDLIKEVNEAKRQGNYKVTDPTARLKSALETAKTVLRNQLRDMQKEIDDGVRIIKNRTVAIPDVELQEMRADRDTLQQRWDEIFKQPKTDAERIAALEKVYDQQISKMEADLGQGKILRKVKSEPLNGPGLQARRAKLNALRAMRDEMRQNSPEFQVSEEQRQHAAVKRILAKSLLDWQERAAWGSEYGDFSLPEKKPLKRDAAEEASSRKIDQVKKDFSRLKEKATRNRPLDVVRKMIRLPFLTFMGSMPKLSAAAFLRFPEAAYDEFVASGLRKLPGIGKLMEAAPVHGGGSPESVLRGWAKGLTQGFYDSWDSLSKGANELSQYPSERDNLVDTILGFPGNIHDAIKAPAARMAYERAMLHSLQFEQARGCDPQAPDVIQRSHDRAVIEALRAKLGEKNPYVQALKLAAKQIDDAALGGHTIAQTVQTAITPILKVPTNFIGQTLERLIGTFTGGYGAVKIIREGIDKIASQPDGTEQIDMVARRLVKGTGGLFGLALAGYFGSQYFGGLWEKGDKKRKPGEMRPGQIGPVPPILTHNSALEAMQFGAQVRKNFDKHANNGESFLYGASAALGAVFMGLTDELPMIRARELYDKLHTGQGVQQTLQQYTTPGFMRENLPPAPKKHRPLRKVRY